MDIATILLLIKAGVTTVEKIQAARAAGAIQLTDDQLNAILDGVIAEANRRADLAHTDAHPTD